MVADLLELRHRGQHVAAPGDALGLLDPGHHLVDDGLVERGLLDGERAVLLHLDLVRQVVDDGRIGLQPAQQVRPGDRAQRLAPARSRRTARPGSAYRVRNTRADPSRPGLTKSITDHSSANRFSTGVPVSAIRWSAGMRRTAAACRDALFFTVCASSSTTRRQLWSDEQVAVPGGDGVRGDNQVGLVQRARRIRCPRSRSGAVMDVNPQRRGECGGLALPVADHRHRADQQRRPARRIVGLLPV